MKILVHVADNTPLDSFSLQIFDRYFAYQQSKNRHNNYQVHCEIKIGKNMPLESDAVNIGFYYMPSAPVSAKNFDLVIVDGQMHHLEVCTAHMYRAFVDNDNCYFLTGAVVDADYPRSERLLSFPHGNIFVHDFFTRPYYPQYYDRFIRDPEPDTRSNMIFINGQNRPHRQFMMDLIRSTVGPAVPVRQNIYNSERTLQDCFFETQDDTKFREYVNANFKVEKSESHLHIGHFSIPVGMNEKFGKISPAHFILEEYFSHHCVIFPESTWLNNEMCVTEKLQKCVVARAIPWPMAGANVDVLYNKLGFQTAWNLLPDQLQSYNYEQDHVKRYHMCAEAIKWVSMHPEILVSDQAKQLIDHNYNLFFSNAIEVMGPIKLDQIIRKHAK